MKGGINLSCFIVQVEDCQTKVDAKYHKARQLAKLCFKYLVSSLPFLLWPFSGLNFRLLEGLDVDLARLLISSADSAQPIETS